MSEAAFQDQIPDNHCFGCGPHNANGLRIKSYWDGDEAVSTFTPQPFHMAGPTNVLSFPTAETARPFLGDVILAHGVCTREAAEQGKSIADHLRHLVIHGVLHLLGHDHIEDDEAEAMEARERTLLAKLGVPDPYAVSR